MKAKVFAGKVDALKAMAERAIEAHRGDGLAEPVLEICNVLIDGLEPEEEPDQPADSDGGTKGGKNTTAPK